jgi:hypothetical protein
LSSTRQSERPSRSQQKLQNLKPKPPRRCLADGAATARRSNLLGAESVRTSPRSKLYRQSRVSQLCLLLLLLLFFIMRISAARRRVLAAALSSAFLFLASAAPPPAVVRVPGGSVTLGECALPLPSALTRATLPRARS